MDTLAYFARLTDDAMKWTAHISPLSDAYVGPAAIHRMLCDLGVFSREHIPSRMFVCEVLDIGRLAQGKARLDMFGRSRPLSHISYDWTGLPPNAAVGPFNATSYIYF